MYVPCRVKILNDVDVDAVDVDDVDDVDVDDVDDDVDDDDDDEGVVVRLITS